jgi:uncharacterized protein (UPF0303 family)
MSEPPETLGALEAEFEELQFESFGFDDAWAIGQDLVVQGLAGRLPIAIDVGANGQVLFHADLPGSSPDNDQWILRKDRVALRFHRSSLYIAALLREKGKTIEEKYGLPEADYAPYGGAVPIRVRGAGVIGTVTVSGLADHEDHRMAAGAIRRRITRSG